jgi:tetratricopeptide (TPR) repeat protein
LKFNITDESIYPDFYGYANANSYYNDYYLKDISYFMQKGNEFLVKNDFNRAIDFYSKVIELKEDYFLAYFNKGVSYQYLNKEEEAIGDFTKAIELKNNSPVAYFFRGNSYSQKGNDEKAIDDYTIAINLNPNYKEAYINRGYLHSKLNNGELALQDFNTAVALDPEFDIAYNNLGFEYIKMGRLKEAEKSLLRAVEINPKYILANLNLALLKFLNNNIDISLEILNKINIDKIELYDSASFLSLKLAIEILKNEDYSLTKKRLIEILKSMKEKGESLKYSPDELEKLVEKTNVKSLIDSVKFVTDIIRNNF